MRLFGLKLRRLKDWWGVVQEEDVQFSLKHWFLMAKEAAEILFGGGVQGAEYRKRLRICAKCPIREAGEWRCRPYTGSELGCGCYIPYVARNKRACWVNELVPEMGWGESQRQ